jgi:hypothetical protein
MWKIRNNIEKKKKVIKEKKKWKKEKILMCMCVKWEKGKNEWKRKRK